jgi:hypothetical protein
VQNRTGTTRGNLFMKFVNQLLAQHFERYPRMQLDDIYG